MRRTLSSNMGRRLCLLSISFIFLAAVAIASSRELSPGPSPKADTPANAEPVKSEAAGPDLDSGAVVSERCNAAGLALMRGITFLENQEPTAIEDAFIVSHIYLQAKRKGLEGFIQKAREMYKNDPAIWYLTAGSPRMTLPDPLPAGKARLELITNTPQMDPPRKAYDLLIEFLVTPCNGYLLTHQVFMLEVAKSRKVELPENIFPDGSQYMGKVSLEHAEDSAFSDLYARRTFLLLLYTMPDEKDANIWIDVLLKAQREDGSWLDEHTVSAELGGETFTVQPTQVRTTAYTTYAMAVYVKRFCEPEEVIQVK